MTEKPQNPDVAPPLTAVADPLPARRGLLARRSSQLFFACVAPVMKPIQRTRAEQFETLRAVPGAIVFLGDSISEGGLWSEWFPAHLVSNRGIGGENTTQVLRRLDSATCRSRAVFLLAGTNDLAQGQSPSAIAARLALIVDGVAARSPGCPVYLQSVMPRKPRFAAEIHELNGLTRLICEARSHAHYVDLWPALATTEAGLRAEFTHDDLHLNGAGYSAWVDVIRPLVEGLDPLS